MRIYIFKSETRRQLHAFAGDPMGSKLPPRHGPWTVTGVIGADRVLMGPKRDEIFSEDVKRRTAYHESGHAIVGWYLPAGDPPAKPAKQVKKPQKLEHQ